MTRKVSTGRPSTRYEIIEMDIITLPHNKQIGAYTIEHLPSGKVYHGSTINLHRRVGEHCADLRAGKHVNSKLLDLYKEGGILKLTFFPEDSREAAIAREQELIDSTPRRLLLNRSFDATNNMKGMWENPELRKQFTRARKGNKNALDSRHTDEWKAEASKRLRGNKHRLGHVHTEESRRKMSKSQTGLRPSEEAILKTAAGRTRWRIIIDGVIYQNSAAAAKVIGISEKGITKRCFSDNFPNYRRVLKWDLEE